MRHFSTRTRWMAASLGLLALFVPAGRAVFAGDIVFDPANWLENVRQTVALAQQIQRAVLQIELLARQLQHLPESILEDLTALGDRIQARLNESFDPLATTVEGASNQLESRFPVQFTTPPFAWREDQEAQWTESSRATLVDLRNYQNAVAQELETSAALVDRLVRASNGEGLPADQRPGLTAVLQARNELMALLTTETQRYIGLRALTLQRRVDQLAEGESAAAHQAALRDHLRQNGFKLRDSSAVLIPYIP